MAIETPVEVIRRLQEQARQQRLAQAEAPARAFREARTPKQQASAFGQQIGLALAKAFQGEEDVEQDPQVIQARKRADWFAVAPDDVEGLKRNVKAAHEAQDYQAANYLTDRYVEAERLRLARETLEAQKAKTDTPKAWKWKHWQTDTRNIMADQAKELSWVRDINDEDEEQKVADSIVARAESMWNTWREKGIDISPERAYSLAENVASKHFKKGMIDDTFDFAGFSTDVQDTFNLGTDKYEGKEERKTTAPSKKAPKVGSIREFEGVKYRLVGGDWRKKENWRPIKAKKAEEGKPSGFVDVPIRNPFADIIKPIAPVDYNEDDFDI